MSDQYNDSEYRYQNDVAFRHAVDLLQHMAIEHGFTPGELKQIAFYAALRVEMYAVRPIRPWEHK